MNNITREYIRRHFSDFRYLSSTDEPHIIREFVRYEEVVNFINKLSESERINGSYDMYLRLPTENEYREEAIKYADGDIPSYIAFVDGVKYTLKMFSTPRTEQYLKDLNKQTSVNLPF